MFCFQQQQESEDAENQAMTIKHVTSFVIVYFLLLIKFNTARTTRILLQK